MTPRTYRYLLLSSLVLGIVGALFDALLPSVLPPAFGQAQEMHDSSLPTSTMVFGAIAGFVLLVTGIAAFVGLYLFRPWAPRLALITTAIALVVIPPLGPMALSGWAMGISELSSTLWGAVLALTYFSPLSQRFVRADPS